MSSSHPHRVPPDVGGQETHLRPLVGPSRFSEPLASVLREPPYGGSRSVGFRVARQSNRLIPCADLKPCCSLSCSFEKRRARPSCSSTCSFERSAQDRLILCLVPAKRAWPWLSPRRHERSPMVRPSAFFAGWPNRTNCLKARLSSSTSPLVPASACVMLNQVILGLRCASEVLGH